MSRVFIELSSDTHIIGRVEIELFVEIVPKSAENFRCLCTGERGTGVSGKALWYKQTTVSQVVPGFGLKLGDTTGCGGESIFGSTFADESFDGRAGRHTGPGCVSMANSGPDSNASQFFLLTSDTPWMNGKHVVIGEVRKGMDVVKAVESLGSRSGVPSKNVFVSNCGQVL